MTGVFKGALAVLALAVFSGCSMNYYNVPRDTYEKKVRTLGVVPILIDTASDIRHPQKDELIALLTETNRKNEKRLVEQLKNSGAYFSVTLLDYDAEKGVEELVSRRERRDDAGVIYNKFFLKPEALRKLIDDNHVDAVMVLIVSGITRHDRMLASNLVRYLDTEYNHLILTAQIVDTDGFTLWEYPNFRQKILALPPLVSLQYPDFDEADNNLEEHVELKFKTVAGIRRALEKRDKDMLFREMPVSRQYGAIFTDMVSMLKPEKTLFGGGSDKPPAEKK